MAKSNGRRPKKAAKIQMTSSTWRNTSKRKKAAIKNLEKAREARRLKALRAAQERIESPPQPKDVHLEPAKMSVAADRVADFSRLIEDFDDAVRLHNDRGSGDPDDVDEKERYYEFTKARLLAYAYLF